MKAETFWGWGQTGDINICVCVCVSLPVGVTSFPPGCTPLLSLTSECIVYLMPLTRDTGSANTMGVFLTWMGTQCLQPSDPEASHA